MRPITHYRDLIPRYLLQHKRRSMLTALGILLSAALLFSSSAMGETLKSETLQTIKDTYGDYHVAYLGVTESQIAQLKANAETEEVGSKLDVGIQNGPHGTRLSVTGGDSGFLDFLGLRLGSGKLPGADGEIALEQWYVDQLPEKPRIGDRIRLSVVQQPGVEQTDSAAKEKAPAEPKTLELDLVLTGIFKNKTTTQLSGNGFGVMTLDYARKLDAAGSTGAEAKADAGVRFKRGVAIQQGIRDTASAIGATDKQIAPNKALLKALGQSGDRSQNRFVNIAEGIVTGIILIATVAVIYNAFHISVIERIRQFGVLRSIGMTPRQIRVMVFGEASMLALISIPLGLAAGWAAIEAVLAVFTRISPNLGGAMRVAIPWYVPAGTIVLSLAAVYLSAYGPARSAGKVSPLTAILHQNQFAKEKAVRRKRRLIVALLGITGKMALDNLARNRRRVRITLFSMCVGITLFIVFWSFMSDIRLSQSRLFAKDYAIETGESSSDGPANGLTVQDYEEAARIPGVKTVYRVAMAFRQLALPADKATDAFLRHESLNPARPPKIFWSVQLLGYRPQDLSLSRSRLVQGSLDASLMDRENGVVLSQMSRVGNTTIAVSRFRVGDTIELASPTDVSSRIKLKVVGLADKMPVNYNGSPEQFTVITTETVFGRITGVTGRFSRFDMTVDRNADQQAIKDRLQQLADRGDGRRIMDFVNSDNNNATAMIGILLYGLVTVISLISAINIVNTISTNLILRTREFGTLRAVGMTMRQMRRMIVYESVWYGVMATLVGGTAGTLLSGWLFRAFNGLQTLPYRFPWPAIVGSGAAALAICLLASRVPLRRIAAMDVVQAIRAEE